MLEPLPSVGGHNSLVTLILVLISLWFYRVVSRIFESIKILKSLRPSDAIEGDEFTGSPSVLHLPGVNHLVEELKILSRRHLEQIVASSSQLRHAPVVPAVFSVLAHIDAESISLDGSVVSCDILLSNNATARSFAVSNVPFSIIEVWSVPQTNVSMSGTIWWRDAVLSALLPCSKRLVGEATALNVSRENNVETNRLAPLRALESGGVRISSSGKITLPVSQMGQDDTGMIPLVVGVACGEGMELSLCKVGSSGRVEVIKQLLLPQGLTICGLYGFEESSSPECMICCDRRVNTVLLPCCHCSLCQICAQNLRDGKCPICRGIYSSYVSLPVRDAFFQTAGRLPQPSQVNATPSTPLLT
jgi:Zinc finger, C3HC4 type (RING finger)